jgi:hypothetical protein
MRKIVAGLFISLDGVVEAPGEWHFPYSMMRWERWSTHRWRRRTRCCWGG